MLFITAPNFNSMINPPTRPYLADELKRIVAWRLVPAVKAPEIVIDKLVEKAGEQITPPLKMEMLPDPLPKQNSIASKTFFIIGIVLLAGLVVYYQFRRREREEIVSDASETNQTKKSELPSADNPAQTGEK